MDTKLRFDRQGLIPVVIQDESTAEVLMVAFMNEEALRLTRESGYTHFFSRSRAAIWRKGESSGHFQEVRAIYVNCEENSLLIRVTQHGQAACHDGYRSCYYRRLQPDGNYEIIAPRVFDPGQVYGRDTSGGIATSQHALQTVKIFGEEQDQTLERAFRQLFGAYLYLREHDLSEVSNTSRLLQDHDPHYLLARLADELQELTGVQTGAHAHSGRVSDTILEGSQVGYWLMLLATSNGRLRYDDFQPHTALLQAYQAPYSEEKALEQQQECLSLLASDERSDLCEGLRRGFALIGWACAQAGISPLAPAEYDLEQMRRKGLVP